MADRLFVRSYPLEHIARRAEGDGRTVEAYAAVFNRTVEVSDWDGDYDELIRPGSFRKTIAERRTNFGVLYNHGVTIHGTSSDRFSLPLGTPKEVREDSKGLLTVTHYAKTPLADEILELIDNGAVRSQSFSGKWMQSREVEAGPNKRRLVERLEVTLREYGPCTFPVYDDAKILTVRSQELAAQIQAMSAEERTELATLLVQGTPIEAAPPGGTSDEPPSDDTPDPAGAKPPEDEGPSPDQLVAELELRRRRLQLSA